ncbi:MAG: class II aldolase/adducin family protein [Caldiserica bacterium]|nr:class II aldolase/adducin family protein [Caldisericota bacterium]MDH7563171.1 class II aldolase/adducin family protein [Caldisericota bacterium]
MSDIREEIVNFGKLLYQRRLNFGYGGNLSFRRGERIFITPAGLPKHRLSPEQILETDLEGKPLTEGRPSSESRMHFEIYKTRTEVNAIIHAHPPFLTVMAVTGQDFIPILPEMEMVLGKIAKIPYFRPGTAELALAVKEGMRESKVGVLLNHGALSIGHSLEEAFDFLEMAESFARTLVFSNLQGKFNILTPQEVEFFRGKASH